MLPKHLSGSKLKMNNVLFGEWSLKNWLKSSQMNITFD